MQMKEKIFSELFTTQEIEKKFVTFLTGQSLLCLYVHAFPQRGKVLFVKKSILSCTYISIQPSQKHGLKTRLILTKEIKNSTFLFFNPFGKNGFLIFYGIKPETI